MISPGSPPLLINGLVYCLLIASNKFVHSSASFDEVLTTWVVLLTCSSPGNLSSIIAKMFGNFLTSTFSPSFLTDEIILTTGTLLSKFNKTTLSLSKRAFLLLTPSTLSVIATLDELATFASLLFIAGEQPDNPNVAANAISKPLMPLSFTPSFL